MSDKIDPSRATTVAHESAGRTWGERLRIGGWKLHYQPQYDLHNAEMIGVEALLRCTSDRGGALPAGEVVADAERTGVIQELGRAILARACLEHATWIGSSDRPVPTVSVNVSPLQLVDRGLVAHVEGSLAAAAMSPSQLVIELTEGPLPDTGGAVGVIEELRALGIKLALDDFGVAASSLSRLQTLAPDQIKLDRSFVTNLCSNPVDRAIVGGAVQLASTLGVQLIVEGIETDEQLRVLIDLGGRYGQGYLLSRPVAPNLLAPVRPPPVGCRA